MIEHTLRNDSADGPDHFEITLKFTFDAQPHGDGNADERQATEAVATASRSVMPLGSTPAVVGLLNSVVDTGTKVTTKIQTFNNTWGILLKRMELFNKIVTDIAQVFGLQRLAFLMT